MLGYVGLVYAFMGDIFIFHQSFGWLQITGISVIITLNVALLFVNCKKIDQNTGSKDQAIQDTK